MKHCESKERKALGAMYYLLTSKNMPVFVKSLAIKAKQQPIVTYGDEVWGMSTNRCKDIITNEACRLVLMVIKIGYGTNSIRARDCFNGKYCNCQTS
jgi:hypothetical protein